MYILGASDRTVRREHMMARWDDGNCNTCGFEADRPYRRYEANKGVVEGCVDAIHTTNDAWHNSKSAKAIRKSWALYLRLI